MGWEEVFEGLLSTWVGSQLGDTVLLTAEDLDVMIWKESKTGNNHKANLQDSNSGYDEQILVEPISSQILRFKEFRNEAEDAGSVLSGPCP